MSNKSNQVFDAMELFTIPTLEIHKTAGTVIQKEI